MCDDPTILAFLAFLEQDIERHPERLQPLSDELAAQMDSLTEGMTFDPAEPIKGEVTF